MNKQKSFWILALISLVCVSIVVAEESGTISTKSPAGWEGSWNSLLYMINFTVTEKGDVNSTYVPFDPESGDPGVIEGTLTEEGKVLVGSWTEGGACSFTLSDDATFFNGTYVSIDANGHEYSSAWDGVRIIADESDKETGWNGSWQSNNDIVTLQQNGSVITGTYEPYNPGEDYLSEPGVIEGTLSEDCKNITGTWKETGKLRLTLSNDGKVFNGTYGFGSEDHLNGSADDSWNGTRNL